MWNFWKKSKQVILFCMCWVSWQVSWQSKDWRCWLHVEHSVFCVEEEAADFVSHKADDLCLEYVLTEKQWAWWYTKTPGSTRAGRISKTTTSMSQVSLVSLWHVCSTLSDPCLPITPAVSSHHLTYPLTTRVVGAPQMISLPVSSIFLCSSLPSGIWQSPGLSIPWCCLPASSFFLLLCALSSSFFHCTLQYGFGQT